MAIKVPSKLDDESHSEVKTPESERMDMESVYLEVRGSLMRFASRYFRRPQEVEDVVQEAFVKVIEAHHRREIKTLKGYLFRTTKNLALKQLGKKSYKLTDTVGDALPDSILLHSQTLEDEFESRQKFELFCRAVRDLPVKGRRAFVLRRVYGYSQQEIAEEMGIGRKTVEAHLSKAFRRCVDFMEAEENQSGEDSGSRGREHG